MRVIDRDRVDEHNVSTQLYGERDRRLESRGLAPAAIPRHWRRDRRHAQRTYRRTARSLLPNGGLVIDTFDNSASRRLGPRELQGAATAVSARRPLRRLCEVIWDDPLSRARTWEDVCDSRWPDLVLLVVALASEVIVRFVRKLSKDWSATLRDLPCLES